MARTRTEIMRELIERYDRTPHITKTEYDVGIEGGFPFCLSNNDTNTNKYRALTYIFGFLLVLSIVVNLLFYAWAIYLRDSIIFHNYEHHYNIQTFNESKERSYEDVSNW